MHRRNIRLPLPVVLAVLFAAPLNLAQGAPPDVCERAAEMQVYSNARYIEEAGDVIGDELAVQRREGNSIDALLYFYQGEPNKDGIALSGHIVGEKLTMEGDWIQHLFESPSNQQIVETHHVTVTGTLNSNWFRGSISLGSRSGPDVKLRHVPHIWMCKGANPASGRTP